MGTGPGEFRFTTDDSLEANNELWTLPGRLGGIAADDEGAIYVADSLNERIQKFDKDGVYLDEWSCGTLPSGLAFGGGNALFCGDRTNRGILKYSTDGTLLDSWNIINGWPEGRAIPMALASDSQGNVLVSDNGNRVQKFSSDGDLLAVWTSAGTDSLHVGWPTGAEVDDDSLLVADNGNCTVKRFSLDGRFESEWGGPGSGPGQFSDPRDVGVGPDRTIYVADAGNDRVQKLASDG
ncbi:MAG: hypothetical protein GY851_32140, partial [bacterium]|nr:hypothetical protein [bacterium]